MPIYEYQCTACGEHTEILQKINDAPATDCPACHEDALQKQVSATCFQLKGNGWYVTDFKNKNQKSNVSTGENKTSEKSSNGTEESIQKPNANAQEPNTSTTK